MAIATIGNDSVFETVIMTGGSIMCKAKTTYGGEFDNVKREKGERYRVLVIKSSMVFISAGKKDGQKKV
jgi:hypothetical protein